MKQAKPAHLAAGVCAGVAGLLAFLIIHAMWILPIWFIFPLGLLIAGVGGLAVGWSYAELGHRLPKRPWTALAISFLIGAILSPAVVLAELRQPMFSVSAAGVTNLAVGLPEAVFRFSFELLLTTSLTAGVLGWWVGRTRRAAFATALAGFVFALGPGHNIPFIGGTPGVMKELLIMSAVILVSALVLVEGHAWLQAFMDREQERSYAD
ncbi:MAG: hypothetical protein JSV61_04875 [Anaerolineales bacterium]|nr:MAG: hypothetical protein JSV61_04875 [Anaerolineales bacterium]